MSATAPDRPRPATAMPGTQEFEGGPAKVGRLKPAPTADCPLIRRREFGLDGHRKRRDGKDRERFRQRPGGLTFVSSFEDISVRHQGVEQVADVDDDEHDRYTETETLVEDMCARRRGEA